ncbi:MAG: hypothetical protein V3W44_02100 [Dehalococcoidales bacterium]
MSCTGSFQLGGELFPTDPLTKRWSAQQVGRRGTREPIFANVQRLEMDFGTLRTQAESDFFESRFSAGGLYVAVLPHPVGGVLTQFTGVAVEDYSFEFTDVEQNFWADSARLALSVPMSATGTA